MKHYGNRIKQSQTIDNGETRRDWRRDKKKIERDRDREREKEREREKTVSGWMLGGESGIGSLGDFVQGAQSG